MPTEALLDTGPSPTIRQPYRVIRATHRGRLSACADSLGTLQLHLQEKSLLGSRVRLMNAWRSGPLRRCEAVLDALKRSLIFLEEASTTEDAVRLARRIDRRLGARLTNFVLIGEGKHQLLADQVRFSDQADSLRGMPPGSWTVARLQGDAQRTPQGTFMLARRARTWELWMRTEPRNPGPAPHRNRNCMCSLDLLHEEPQYAAELLLYALFQREQQFADVLADGAAGLIPPSRMAALKAARALPPT